MATLRFAIVGTGFWARYQLAAWRELGGAECVALCDRARAKAERLAAEFGVPAVYDDAEEMLRRERPDFLDVITDAATHAHFVRLAAAHRVAVICQKPMAPTYEEAAGLVKLCREAGVPFFVHENWRWQTPLRCLKSELDAGKAGRPFRARLTFCSSFPVFDNQPALKELDEFIIADLGTHLLDAARFLFGEAESLYCQTHRVRRDIRGEDVATVVMRMGGATVTCEMSYASRLERDHFPETLALVEGGRGSIELCPDHWIRTTTEAGTHARRHAPPRYAWADPAYDLVQASMVPCNADLLAALSTGNGAETGAEDNLKTVRLVAAAYESARTNRVINLSE
jgi:D-apiose dehydrogenase